MMKIMMKVLSGTGNWYKQCCCCCCGCCACCASSCCCCCCCCKPLGSGEVRVVQQVSEAELLWSQVRRGACKGNRVFTAPRGEGCRRRAVGRSHVQHGHGETAQRLNLQETYAPQRGRQAVLSEGTKTSREERICLIQREESYVFGARRYSGSCQN